MNSCICVHRLEEGNDGYGYILNDDKTVKEWRINPACEYHQAAAAEPFNHRIPWNCPTYWDGCNCKTEFKELRAEIERLAGLLEALLYVPHKGPGVSPVVLYRTKEGHLVGQALQREEDAHLDTLARALRAETENAGLRERCEEVERLRTALPAST